MFGSLKKHLKSSIQRLAKKVEEKPEEEKEETAEAPEKGEGVAAPGKAEVKEEAPVTPEKLRIEIPGKEAKAPVKEPKGRIARIREKITVKRLSGKDVDDFFAEAEIDLLQANVAVEAIDFIKKHLKEKLSSVPVKRGEAGDFVMRAFEDALFALVNQGGIKLESMVKEKRPLKMVFLGFNGSGKTTSIAKVAKYLQDKGYRPVLAAGDTFRAASIEQLEHHGERLGLKTIKHGYGADSAAVVFDAVKHAETRGFDAVLADTAGRMHTDKNLMDELEKVCRVNRPDLKVLVVDSLTGNDAVEQAKKFNEGVGVDAVILTKTDVNEKGGSILSVCYAIKKPVLFLGTGQGYSDLKSFEPRGFVKELLE
jgi:fused signal recognition particle receptor